MPFRFLEAFLPGPDTGDLKTVLDEHKPAGYWETRHDEHTVHVRILLDAGKTEAVLGILESRYAGNAGYRVILLPVEATVPAIEPPAPVPTPNAPEDTTPKSRVSIAELMNDVKDMLGTGRIFFTLVILSTIVAAIGLYTNNVAVIIGAMVIAPLLGPSVALSLATALADPRLAGKAARAAGLGTLAVLAIAILIGYAYPVDSTTPEIRNRTVVGLQDLLLALASGVAGTLSITTAVSSALVGVMVAVALLPPLVTFGLLVGNAEYGLAYNAFLLVAVNVISINLAGVGTFLVQGVRPRLYWDQAKARKATLIALVVWTLLLAALAYLVVLTDATRPA